MDEAAKLGCALDDDEEGMMSGKGWKYEMDVFC